MVTLLYLIHIAVCLALIVIVLLQPDKSEGLAGAFGGGASATIFGERGSGGFISNLTTGLAIAFMITSLILSVWAPKWASSSSAAPTNINYGYDNTIPVSTEVPATTNETTATPIETTAQPQALPAPSTEIPAPTQREAVPVENTPAVESTPAPVETKPAETIPAPAETSATPVETSAAPVETAPTAVAPIAPAETAPTQAPLSVPVTTAE